jgi:hypothetical protein
VRVHGTTRCEPKELYERIERATMQPLPETRFEVSKFYRRKVQKDCHIYLKYNFYSVPAEYTGLQVDIESDGKILRIYYEDKQIAIHQEMIGKRGQFYTREEDYPEYKIGASKEKYEERFIGIGEEASRWFSFLIKEERYWNKLAAGVLALAKKHGESVTNLACKRARFYRITSWRKIKEICEQGLYRMPLDGYEEE